MSKIYVTALASNNPKDKADWIEDKIDNELQQRSLFMVSLNQLVIQLKLMY